MVSFRIAGEDPLLAEFYSAIGLLIQEWAWVEFDLKNAIIAMMEADFVDGLVALAGMQSRSLIITFRTLALHKFPKDKREIDRMFFALEQSATYRNEIAHNTIMQSDKYPSMIALDVYKAKVKKRGLIYMSTHHLSLQRLRRRVLYIEKTNFRLKAFVDKRDLDALREPST
jgi:hypothetical protein